MKKMEQGGMRTRLTTAVEQFAAAYAGLAGEQLDLAWPDPAPIGRLPAGYERGVREAPYRMLIDLRSLAADIAATRSRVTLAQHILGQHHIAWREFTGALLTVTPEELDREPGGAHGCDWTLRDIQHHLMMTEAAFRALNAYAVERFRAGEAVAHITRDLIVAANAPVRGVGDQAALLAEYAGVHAAVQVALVDVPDGDLAAQAQWWEEYPIPVRWRLHRFEAHLREHTIHIEKTLGVLGHIPGEAERMARMLHRALGEVEALLLGASDSCAVESDALAERVDAETVKLRQALAA